MNSEHFSIINYKGKTIMSVDYSKVAKNKASVLELMATVDQAYEKAAEGSALVLVNVANMQFDMEILNKFKEAQKRYEKKQKKVALVGVSGLLKAGYNFVIGLTSTNNKAFNSEEEAKEWLIAD